MWEAFDARRRPRPSLLMLVLAFLLVAKISGQEEEEEVEYPPYDGWFNNLANPSWGGAETQLFRRVPPMYDDGVYMPHTRTKDGKPRPNPIDISRVAFRGPTGFSSIQYRTALLVFFGQQMVEEILDAQRPGCPPEYFNIKVPENDTRFNPDGRIDIELPLLRSRYDMNTGLSPSNPRQQLNEISAWFDGTLMYGGSKAWTDAIRALKGGRLASLRDTDPDAQDFPARNDIRLPMANPPPPRDHYLKPVGRFYRLGNPRGNENPFLLTFGILWYRFHNYKADEIQAKHPDWSDEKVFNHARKWVIAVHQKIVYYDWLPSWLGITIPPYFSNDQTNNTINGRVYNGYDPTINPGIAHEFQTSAMRFGHTLVPPGVYRRSKKDENGNCVFYNTSGATGEEDKKGYLGLRTCQTYWNPQEGVDEHDIDALLMGMASQVTEREDAIITQDLRDSVFGPLEFSRRDLMAVNIQRARDHGVPDYNTVRRHFNLLPRNNFSDIVNPDDTADPVHTRQVIEDFGKVYDWNIDAVDLWPAGMLETTTRGPGPTFRAIILDQFMRIRHGDRFWFENNKINRLFNDTEIAEIRTITIKVVIMATTNISDDDIQDNPFFLRPDDTIIPTGSSCRAPEQLHGNNNTFLASCTAMQTFDYFSGSEWSYALSFTALFSTLFMSIGCLYCAAKHRERAYDKQRSQDVLEREPSRHGKEGYFIAEEWVSKKEGCREVRLMLDNNKKLIMVKNHRDKLLRTIDLKLLQGESSRSVEVAMSADYDMRVLLLRVPREYDLVLQFVSNRDKTDFYQELRAFITSNGLGMDSPRSLPRKQIHEQARTKNWRQQLLDKFFRAIFARAFSSDAADIADIERKEAQDVLNCELTKYEFAETLQLTANSLFVKQMFEVVDEDKNGYISFREFLGMIVVFFNGTGDEKVKLMFKMYDSDGSGRLTGEDLKTMFRSLMELANDTLEEGKMDELINKMFGSQRQSKGLTFEEFNAILGDYQGDLDQAKLKLNIEAPMHEAQEQGKPLSRAGKGRATFQAAYRNKRDDEVAARERKRFSMNPTLLAQSSIKTEQKKAPTGKFEKAFYSFRSWFATYKRHVFWLSLYTLVTLGIFAERAYYYAIEREHSGLRQIAGLGVSVTRGAASVMMFTYSCLLVTMCRNTITLLRETFLHRYIPFDSAVAMHKFIAWFAAVFTMMHCIGHCINFYHIATQTADDLSCLFRNYYHPTDALPKFHYWLYNTITGFTGVLLTIVFFVMYVFAQQIARRKTFRAFYITHRLYILLYILMIMHGAGRLIQAPFIHYFFLGPCLLFVFDKIVSVSRRKIELAVVKAELLPSDVTYLKFQKPEGFDYKSGQWVRIASTVMNDSEYHPFTLTSAPHEEHLMLHIRALGPWTYNIRTLYDPNRVKEHRLPKIFLDGPYGEGHQDWYRYDVAVLVGGGIGVTPFASILKDIAHRPRIKEKIRCKKVYFLWVTRTQKQFEWMTDIIREVEENDTNDIVSVHIFITQFKEKFDVRTTMLYICERYFHKISSRSLFTGLRSVTHFGRPNFEDFMMLLQNEHADTDVFGVFSCGPPPMTLAVEKACATVNQRLGGDGLFVHHYENF